MFLLQQRYFQVGLEWGKMPFVKVMTNLPGKQLPRNFVPRLNAYLAGVLDKDPALFKWTLETDKVMGLVSGMRMHTQWWKDLERCQDMVK